MTREYNSITIRKIANGFLAKPETSTGVDTHFATFGELVVQLAQIMGVSTSKPPGKPPDEEETSRDAPMPIKPLNMQ